MLASKRPRAFQPGGERGIAAPPGKCPRDQGHRNFAGLTAPAPTFRPDTPDDRLSYSTNRELTESSLLILSTVSASKPATDNTLILLLTCPSLRSGMVSVTTT